MSLDIDLEEMRQILQRWREKRLPKEHSVNLLSPRFTMLDMQLHTIKELVHRHQKDEVATQIKFDKLDAEIEIWSENEQLKVLRQELFFEAVFMNSAHSMAAVGMLAPFIESLYVAIFQSLGDMIVLPTNHPRLNLEASKVWNPKYYYSLSSKGEKCDLLKGIGQLSDASELAHFLPRHTQTTLEALFRYRNNMFHNGFEWPDAKIASFADDSIKWHTGWFELVERNEKPWLFYMTPEFCTHCVDLIDKIIYNTGRYLRTRSS